MADIDKIQISGEAYPISIAPTGHLDSTTGNFESKDGTTSSTTWDDVPVITASQNHKTIFSYVTRMIKNIRVLLNKFTSLNSTVNTIDTRTATSSRLGQVTIGDGISVSSGKISVTTTSLKTMLLDLIYPVGSIFLSYSNVKPSIGGTWIRIGTGFVLATGGRYGDLGESQSGVTSVTLTKSNLPPHNHPIDITSQQHTHTCSVSPAGSHQHSYVYSDSYLNKPTTSDKPIGFHGETYDLETRAATATTSSAGQHTHTVTINKASASVSATIGNTGSSTSFDVKPYTYNVYAWKRIS